MATKTIILDTSIVIDYLRQNSEVVMFVNQYGKPNLALPPIVLMEVYQGVLNKIDLERTRKKLNGFAKIEHSREVAELALQLQQVYILTHHMDIPDTLIAATALVYDLELRTYNIKDFGFIAGIKVSNLLD